MTPTRPVGPEPPQDGLRTAARSSPDPATYGGPSWRARTGTHARDIGRWWAPCGVCSEVDPLREVLLFEPPDTVAGCATDPDLWLMLEDPDLPGMREEASALAAAYQEEGVTVRWGHQTREAPPNLVFARDLFFMTPEGAVLGRMGGEVRAGEERYASQALAALGIPILLTPRGEATFEGADALWLREDLVLLGIGRRTNQEGAGQVGSLLAGMGVRTRLVAVPPGAQHLLGVVTLVDRDLAVCRRDRVSGELRGLLEEAGVRLLLVDPDPEVVDGRATNFVTLRPRRILMPAGCPGVRRVFEGAGISCREAEVGEYLKAAGGPGCITGILWRGPSERGKT